jgi:cobalt/nickel transport system permease protein
MLGVHAFIGIGEALITAAALAFIAATRPDLLNLRPDRAARAAAAGSSATGATAARAA